MFLNKTFNSLDYTLGISIVFYKVIKPIICNISRNPFVYIIVILFNKTTLRIAAIIFTAIFLIILELILC